MANHDKPTEKQLNFIDIIKSYVKDDFHGSTKAEASIWINAHIKEFRKNQELEAKDIDEMIVAMLESR